MKTHTITHVNTEAVTIVVLHGDK